LLPKEDVRDGSKTIIIVEKKNLKTSRQNKRGQVLPVEKAKT